MAILACLKFDNLPSLLPQEKFSKTLPLKVNTNDNEFILRLLWTGF